MKKNYAIIMLSFALTFTNFVNAQTPNFNISKSEIIISENDRPLTNIEETITVTLLNQPSSAVVVTPTYSDETEFTVSPAALTFTSSNWNTPQSFTFTATNDNTADGDKTVNVTITATTSSHDSGSGDGSHDSGSGDGTTDLTAQKNLQVRILDFNETPSNIAGFSVKIGFNTEDYILVSGISDPDGDQVSLTTVKALESGVVELNTGNLLYTPESKFFGSDSVELKITDGIFSTDVTKINIDVIGLGDMNGDGSVSTVDLVFLASHAVGITGYEIPNTFDNVFDVNQDGEVNTVDLVYLASNLVGIDGYDLTIK